MIGTKESTQIPLVSTGGGGNQGWAKSTHTLVVPTEDRGNQGRILKKAKTK